MNPKHYTDPSLYIVVRHKVYGLLLVPSHNHALTRRNISMLQICSPDSQMLLYTPSFGALTITVDEIHLTDIPAKAVIKKVPT